MDYAAPEAAQLIPGGGGGLLTGDDAAPENIIGKAAFMYAQVA